MALLLSMEQTTIQLSSKQVWPKLLRRKALWLQVRTMKSWLMHSQMQEAKAQGFGPQMMRNSWISTLARLLTSPMQATLPRDCQKMPRRQESHLKVLLSTCSVAAISPYTFINSKLLSSCQWCTCLLLRQTSNSLMMGKDSWKDYSSTEQQECNLKEQRTEVFSSEECSTQQVILPMKCSRMVTQN